MNFSSLEDVYQKPWPKKTHGIAKTEPKRDAVQEGRVFEDPRKRGEHSMKVMKKSIDDLTGSLPIVDEDEDSNFKADKVPTREGFSATKTERTPPFYRTDDGTNFAYAPPSFQQDANDVRMQRLYQMLDRQNAGSETPVAQDMLLYIFTGIFFIFAFDTFVNLGKNVR